MTLVKAAAGEHSQALLYVDHLERGTTLPTLTKVLLLSSVLYNMNVTAEKDLKCPKLEILIAEIFSFLHNPSLYG